jgi:cytochrome c
MKNLVIILIFSFLTIAGCAQDTSDPASSDANAPADPAIADALSGDDSGQGNAGADVAQDMSALLANADAGQGKRQFIFCQACHTTNIGGANKVGPNLSGVVGRAAGQAEGFVYSAALADAGLTWDAAALDKWIENPAAMVPGTTMVFAGIRDAEQRANLVAYLIDATGVSE